MSSNFDFFDNPRLTKTEHVWKWTKRALFGLWVLSNVSMCSVQHKIAANRAPAFVQAADGFSVPIEVKETNYRTPAVVNRFAFNWLQMTYNWDAKLGEKQQAVDQGQTVDSKKVTTEAWLASFALTTDLQVGWLPALAERYDFSPYLTGEKSRLLKIKHLSSKEIESGVYEVKVVANWLDMQKGDKKVRSSPFNRVMTLQAIYEAPVPIVEQGPQSQAIRALLQPGLEIIDIKVLKNA